MVSQLERLKITMMEQDDILQEEESKKIKYEKENARRKHNYIPFILEMLKIAANKGDLARLYQEAKGRHSGNVGETSAM